MFFSGGGGGGGGIEKNKWKVSGFQLLESPQILKTGNIVTQSFLLLF